MEGEAFVAAAGRALLADDMGLGKTLQAVAAAAAPAETEGEAAAAEAPGVAGPSGFGDESLAPLLSRIQSTLGERIERVVAVGGGLVVVAEEVDPATEVLVAQLSGEVPRAACRRRRRHPQAEGR